MSSLCLYAGSGKSTWKSDLETQKHAHASIYLYKGFLKELCVTQVYVYAWFAFYIFFFFFFQFAIIQGLVSAA